MFSTRTDVYLEEESGGNTIISCSFWRKSQTVFNKCHFVSSPAKVDNKIMCVTPTKLGFLEEDNKLLKFHPILHLQTWVWLLCLIRLVLLLGCGCVAAELRNAFCCISIRKKNEKKTRIHLHWTTMHTCTVLPQSPQTILLSVKIQPKRNWIFWAFD